MSTNPSINKVLGIRLKEIRNNKHITREALSEKIDVSSRFLADVESGKVGISIFTLKNICETLNISADYLLGLNSEEKIDDYVEIERLIRRIDKKHLNNLNKIISSFQDSVNQQ